ncbi:TPA: JAB domain-containing protein, partial [Aeromonas salmonicida subsp. salmonicida]
MFTEREKRIIALAHSIIARRFTRLDSLNSPEMVVEYLKTRFATLEHETFAMILLDNQHRVINAVDLSHEAWKDAGLPAPNWITFNPKNSHAHY